MSLLSKSLVALPKKETKLGQVFPKYLENTPSQSLLLHLTQYFIKPNLRYFALIKNAILYSLKHYTSSTLIGV